MIERDSERLRKSISAWRADNARLRALLRRGAQLARDLAEQAAPQNPFARVAAHAFGEEVQKALEGER